MRAARRTTDDVFPAVSLADIHYWFRCVPDFYPRLKVEYMSYYAEQADRRAEREESRAAGLEEGRAVGLKEGHAAGLEEGHAAGLEEGHAAGLEESMARGVIQTIKAVQGTKEQAAEQLVLQCGMSEEEALAAVEKYW